MNMNEFDTNAYDTSKVSPDWTYSNLTEARQKYVDRIVEFGEANNIDLTDTAFSRKQLKAVSLSFKDNDDVPNWIVKDHDRRATLGVYFIPEVAEKFTGESPLDSMLSSNTVVVNNEDLTSEDDYVYDFTSESESLPEFTDEQVMSVIETADSDLF